MRHISKLCVLGLMGVGFAVPAFAADDDDGAIITFQLENDTFANTDRNYTNGIVIGYSPAMRDTPWADGLADVLPLMSSYGRERVLFTVGQTMFTPSDITIREPQPDDHPWAGFLFASMELLSEAERHLDHMSLTLGVVGPASQAGETQSFVHDIMHVAEPRGWDNQIDNEPVVNLGYKRSWPGAVRAEPLGLEADITPHVGAALGNAYIHANAGFMVRLGQSLRVDAGPPLIGPSQPGTAVFDPGAGDGWYVFAGTDVRAVARNIFLDGNTFGDGSPSVDKNYLVGELRAGIEVTLNDVRVGYTHVVGTKQFETQRGLTNHGAVSIAVSF